MSVFDLLIRFILSLKQQTLTRPDIGEFANGVTGDMFAGPLIACAIHHKQVLAVRLNDNEAIDPVAQSCCLVWTDVFLGARFEHLQDHR
ncbi:hypothetical protein D9M71_552060 [compost metagenome]